MPSDNECPNPIILLVRAQEAWQAHVAFYAGNENVWHAGVFDAELPIDAALFGVRLVGPGSDFSLQDGKFTDAASADALARQAAQLTFRDIQPTAVFRRVTEFDPFQVRARTSGSNAS